MTTMLLRGVWFAACAATIALAMCCVNSEAADDPAAAAVEQLPAVIRAAADDFRPLGPADVEKAREQLDAAVARLDEQLRADPQGPEWREYLQRDDLERELARTEPDLDVLGEVQQRLSADRAGLEMAWFLDLRDALARYRNTVRNVDNPKLAAAYKQVIEALAQQVEAHLDEPSGERALAIGYLIDQLRGAGQAEQVVGAIRRRLVHPNLRVRVSAEFMAAGLAGPVDERGPVRDCILGTDVHAQGRTVGRTTIELVPSDRFAVIDLVMLATNNAQSVGFNGPARIYSNSTTKLGARKRIWIDAGGVHSYPATSRAITDNRVQRVCAARGGMLVAHIAARRVARSQAEAEAIAADHAEERLERQIDEEAAEPLERLDRLYTEKVLEPLPKRRLFPEQLSFRTTKDAVWTTVLKAGASQLAAMGPPPRIDAEAPVESAVHESLIHNVADQALAGRTFTKEQYEELEAWATDEPGDEPPPGNAESWAVTFPQRRPVSVQFADGGVSITIRVERYHEGDESYPGMDATVRYRIKPTEEGPILVRDGEIAIFPPGFKPGGRARLTPRQVVTRKLLEKRYQRLFKPKLLAEDLPLQGPWAEVGDLRAATIQARDRWLAIAWETRPADVAVAPSP